MHPLKALVLDSWFDNYLGVVSLIRIMQGELERGRNKIQMMSNKLEFQVENVGVFTPKAVNTERLTAGNVGYLIAGLKEIKSARVGDTITMSNKPTDNPLPGFKEVKPTVFAGLYPINSADFESFRVALEKLSLNDSSLSFEPESSQALGFGFRCGFLVCCIWRLFRKD